MEKIIKKAIEGGWQVSEWDERVWNQSSENRVCLFDPLFWQALGKACGWGKARMDISMEMGGGIRWKTKNWKLNALRFHEINLTEGWESSVKWLEDLIK